MSTLRKLSGLARCLAAAGLVTSLGTLPFTAHAALLDQGLAAYDAAVNADATPALVKLTTPVTLDGTAGSPFEFGQTIGSATFEFVLDGDPVATGQSGYLAVGEFPGSSLRFEQWDNTSQLGFTQSGVADYLFAPAAASPTSPTLVTFNWNAETFTMTLFTNGVLMGTAAGVSDTFAMPTGAGSLGANPNGTEAMVGQIHRLTVYDELLTPEDILRHARAGFFNTILSFTSSTNPISLGESATLQWQVQNATGVFLNNSNVTALTSLAVSPQVTTTYTLVSSNELGLTSAKVTVSVNPQLDPYDAAIAADTTSGLVPTATLTNAVGLTGAGGEAFDFGATTDSVTIEFILEGDPVATGRSGYIAVGENSTSSLRYDQWDNTGQLGFTQSGVADYMFAPGVPSPTIATHLTYAWDATARSMKLYVNGALAGTTTGVSETFGMPTGMGWLGSNAGQGEAMVGRIHRVVVYDDLLPEATIQRHALAFTSVLSAPSISSFTATPVEIIGQGSAVVSWQVQNATLVLLNDLNVTTVTNQTVNPRSTTTYTLVASNSVSTVSAKLTIAVTPALAPYDAAIAADAASGLSPLATLTNIVTLAGGGGVPFDFGPTQGDVTMEFIVEGDPVATGSSGYLAVGENATSNLRYDQWNNTSQVGFTQLGVADYLYDPAVPSPTAATHLTFAWNATDLVMSLYVNGTSAGTVPDVSEAFAMPTGAGFLGANPGGGEAMVGRIFRVTVYSGLLPEATILRHGQTIAPPVTTQPQLSVNLAGSTPSLVLSQGTAGAHYRVEFADSLAANPTWQLLQDIPSLSGTTITVTDPTAITGRSQRFYRALLLP